MSDGRAPRSGVLPPALDDWLFRRAADDGVPIAEVIRRAVEREAVADPCTSDGQVNENLARYLAEKYEMDWVLERIEEAYRERTERLLRERREAAERRRTE